MLSRVAERHHRPSTAPLRLVVREPEGLLQVHTASFRGSFASVFIQATGWVLVVRKLLISLILVLEVQIWDQLWLLRL